MYYSNRDGSDRAGPRPDRPGPGSGVTLTVLFTGNLNSESTIDDRNPAAAQFVTVTSKSPTQKLFNSSSTIDSEDQ